MLAEAGSGKTTMARRLTSYFENLKEPEKIIFRINILYFN